MGYLRRRKHECHGNTPCLPHKKLKAVPSAKKVMTTVFWDHQGLLLVDFHTRGTTVNAARNLRKLCSTAANPTAAGEKEHLATASSSVEFTSPTATVNSIIITDTHKREDTAATSTVAACSILEGCEVIN
ncbi:hypothetical protein AVEN_184840-1 [Araneus ventricosus]|uniref:Uncharacterized protein n=1 Tax=Araneus ventricosus TaxID=182803 RepID=A0A4Y2LAZ9_ARAVE|nr:hypothetical protein AVEN_184840-1 [Araneus ventricosus]